VIPQLVPLTLSSIKSKNRGFGDSSLFLTMRLEVTIVKISPKG